MKRTVACALAISALVIGTATASAQLTEAKPSLAPTPPMGWSSWNALGCAVDENAVRGNADAMVASGMAALGYTYIDIDDCWMAPQRDADGRLQADPTRFPSGIKALADYVHGKGLKLGSYLAVGLYLGAYNGGDSPIYGTDNCHTRDLVYPDLRKTNGWDEAYKIDFSNPCGQAYLDSIADQLASWGVDLLKLDGVGPGSFKGGENYDNTEDVKAYRAALDQTGRPIEFLISWALSPTKADVWKANTNGWRIDTDVECYCDTLVTWNNSVKQRWNDVVQWIPHAGPGRWNNLDSLNVGNAEMDGLNEAERMSYMTFWAIESSPLYLGDDLSTLDSYGLSLITNDEVIAINQAGRPG